MQEGLLDINVLRKYIVDVESILALRETCRFFAFRVFPKDWAFQQPCHAPKKLKHVISCTIAPCTIERYLKWTFYGLRNADISRVFRVLCWKPEISRTIMTPWAQTHGWRIVNLVRKNAKYACFSIIENKDHADFHVHVTLDGRIRKWLVYHQRGEYLPDTLNDVIYHWQKYARGSP